MPARFDLDAQASALAQHSYYEATVTRPAEEGPPLTGSIDVDVCVIGAGFAGLSAALECRARGLSVAVLDAHRPGWGASGRNGGQTLVGFAKDEVLEKQLGAAGVRAAWARPRQYFSGCRWPEHGSYTPAR